MANPYPISIIDENGIARLEGLADFTDPGNRPGGGGSVFEQDTDPGAVGAGALWLNTTAIAGTANRPILVRNAADTDWIPVGLAHYDGAGQIRAFVTMSDGALILEKRTALGALAGYLVMSDTGMDIQSVGDVAINPGTRTPFGKPVTFAKDQLADGLLGNSTFTFWLDDTAGTTVLHIKAKDVAGTVVGAAIPLA